MKQFTSCLLLLFLMSCGSKSGPVDVQTVTQTHKILVPAILLQEYSSVPEPKERTVGALIEAFLEERSINARHNQDKRAIKKLQQE